MKKFVFVLALGLMSSMSFATETKTENGNKKHNTEEDWVCCTVSNEDSSVTVCRSDGNDGRACRQARRLARVK